MLGRVFRRAGVVGAGTALGQGAILVATPFLARQYSPAEFGVLALFMTVSNISTALACFRYDQAFPSAPDRDLRGLARVCAAACLVSALIAACIALSVPRLVPLASRTAAGFWTRPLAIATCVLSAGIYQATGALLLRRGAYRCVALMRAGQGVAFAVLAFVPATGLVWAHVLSFLVCGIFIVMTIDREADGTGQPLETALHYADLPKLSLPGAALDVVGYSLCTWIVVAAFGQSAGGEMSQVQRLIGAPLMLVSLSLGQIMLRESAELRSRIPELRRLLHRLLLILIAAACVGFVVLYLIGQPLIALVLGPAWSIDRGFVLAVSTAVFVRACVSPLSSALISLRRFDLALAWQVTYFVSAVLTFSFAAKLLTFGQFVVFYAAHECLLYGVYMAVIDKSVRD